MGIINWFMQRLLWKEARRLAKEVSMIHAKAKSENPSASDKEILLGTFDEDSFSRMSESSRKRIEVCCETVQGFCYMVALDMGKFKGMMNLRSLQFTHYMDRELEALGFPPQSKKQKERILAAIELNIDGWDEITGD